MKKIKIFSLLLIAILFSCNDNFLDRNSLNQMSDGSFWTSESDATIGVNAIYNTLKEQTNDLIYYGMLDPFSDIAHWAWSHALGSGTATSQVGIFSGEWKILYKGIGRANTALSRLPDIKMDEAKKNRLIGETKFLRALFYFKLWDLFGAVPIYDKPTLFDEAYKSRNTSDEVVNFIIKDLTEAMAVLPSSYTGSDQGRATKWAAESLRGKTYLYAKNWAKATTDFDDVIKNSGRELHPQYYQLFDFKWENNKEVIFDVQFIATPGYGSSADIYYGNRNAYSSGWALVYPTNQLVEAYEMTDGSPFSYSKFKGIDGSPFDPKNMENWKSQAVASELYKNRDPRLAQTVITPWSVFIGASNYERTYTVPYNSADPNHSFKADNYIYNWRKFVCVGNENPQRWDNPDNMPLIRFADVLLMYAEAKNELSGPDASIYDAINRIRARVQMPAIPSGTKEEVRSRIQHERLVEFAGEGQRYSDIRRWKIGVQVCNFDVNTFLGGRIATKKFADRENLWPIPYDEIMINKAIIQNPGWEN